MKKILAIFPSFYFDHSEVKVGGGEISNKLILEMVSKEHFVFLICATGDGGWKEKNRGIVVYNLQALFNKFFKKNKFNNYFSKIFLKFFSIILCFYIKPNFIFSGTYTISYGNFYKLFNKKVKNLAFVRAFEHFESNGKNNNFKNNLKKFIYGNYNINELNKVDQIVVNSCFLKNYYITNGISQPISIAYPGVCLQQLPLRPLKKIVSVGMVSDAPHKGIEIFKKLASRFKELEFHVIGAKVDTLKNVGNITYHPWQSKPEILISQMDLFLVPSQWSEPFGRVSVEGIRSGTRVLVSDKGGLPETVNYNTDIVIEDNEINNWIEKINILLSNPNIYDDFYKKLHSHSQNYTENVQYKVILELIGQE
ncbi:glycosyltransferase family 4 protein [Acinetobacter towneri]|uniref:glycosyltransferase family 4 protein n=1 Tax=Acinetobacter towneri TaxID=202956 RepID=UPI001F60B79E|nr:glycosyltransferase family 4 protein [Acinetobacter towneri]UNT61964.1 glycosyltransferase family 4 protein [Acinetobacter towneri]